METELDLKDAQQEAAKVIQQFDDATHGLQVHIRRHKYLTSIHVPHILLCFSIQSTTRDAEEIERRARDAGIKLLTSEEQLQQVEQQVRELRDARVEQQELVNELQQVILGKDEEFTGVSARLAEAENRCVH